MIGLAVWRHWPWRYVRLYAQVSKRRIYRRAWHRERTHVDIAHPWREWCDLGGEAGGA